MKTIKQEIMKTSIYKSLALLAILTIGTSTLPAQEVSKEFHKEYNAQRGNTLELNNRYGNIIVTTSDDNKIVINVLVTLSYPDQERAERLISYIDVEFSEYSGNYIAKTVIDNDFNFSGWGRTNKKFDIKYTVSAPSWLDISVINKYGDVEIGQLDGRFVANIQYGNLTAFGLSRGNVKPVNNISISYGKAEITNAGWLDFTARYASDIYIDQVQAVAFDTKYSKISVNNVSSVVIDSRYDKYNFGNINNLVISGGYSDFDIASITKKLDIESKYGSFNAKSVSPGFEQIDINTSYMGVSLRIDDKASYELEAKVSYGKVEFNEALFDRQKQIINNTSMELKGIVNPVSSGQNGRVFIDSSYGNVKLN